MIGLDEQISLGGAPVVGFGTANALGFGPLPARDFCAKRGQVGDAPAPSGVGQGVLVVPAAKVASPWTVALTTSVVGAATGWVIEEIARRARRRRR